MKKLGARVKTDNKMVNRVAAAKNTGKIGGYVIRRLLRLWSSSRAIGSGRRLVKSIRGR
jgi:hypothetical protein